MIVKSSTSISKQWYALHFGELPRFEKFSAIAVGTKRQDSPPDTLFTTSDTVGFYNIDFREAVFYFSEGSGLTALILERQ